MDTRIENALRKGITAVGRVVESVIGQAKKASVSVASTHGVKPILAIESQISAPKIKELISVCLDRIVKPMIPNLVDKSSLEIGEGQVRFSQIMKERGSAVSVHVDIGRSAGSYPAESRERGIHSLVASPKNIPFEDGFFDFIVANLATPKQGDVVKVIKEIGRLTTLGGQSIIIDFHPFGLFAKKGSMRLRSIESMVRGIEDYYKICKAAGFSPECVREAFIDETMRSYFVSPEEKSSFRAIRETPFLIFLLVNKKGR